MKSIQHLFGFILFLSFFSCSKDLNKNKVVVEGRIIKMPSGQPVNGCLFRIIDLTSSHGGNYYDYIDSYSDINGNYKLEHSFKADNPLGVGFGLSVNESSYIPLPPKIEVQNTSNKQTININTYCAIRGFVNFIDSSATTNPDSAKISVTNQFHAGGYYFQSIYNYEITNPAIIKYILVAGDCQNIIQCKIYRGGSFNIKTDTITPICEQQFNKSFNY